MNEDSYRPVSFFNISASSVPVPHSDKCITLYFLEITVCPTELSASDIPGAGQTSFGAAALLPPSS